MIIKTNLMKKGFDGFTVWPFIFIRPEFADNKALIAHEMVHYQEQKDWYVLPWLLNYWLSKEFRFQAELRGYREQIRVGGITVEEAVKLLNEYGLERTVTAKDLE